MLYPEKVDDGNGNVTTHYVWASVMGLSQILDHSAKDYWPVAWMADDADKKEFNSRKFLQFRPDRTKISSKSQDLRQARDVLTALDSIVRFIVSVPLGK